MAFEKPAVVLDNGSYSIKAGFSCDNHPVSIFRTLVGRPLNLPGLYGREYYEVHVGESAHEHRADLDVCHPVIKGKIVHWDNMERLWHHMYYRELKVAPEDRAVLLACSPLMTMKDKIKCCELFFETFNAPGLCVQPQPVLAIYGSGFTTGICVDLGHDSASVSPVFEGGLVKYAHIYGGVAGTHITSYLKDCLIQRELNLGTAIEDVVEEIKRQHCCIQNKSSPSAESEDDRIFRLPSGEEFCVNAESACTEMVFQPNLSYSEHTTPLPDIIVQSGLRCDPDLRYEMYNAVVPCGGLAMVPGITERLKSELEQRVERSVEVVPSTEAYCTAWMGGAAFAGLTDAEKVWVMKKQFEEQGARVVTNKFIA